MAESKRHMDVPKERVLEKLPHRCPEPSGKRYIGICNVECTNTQG